MRDMGVRGLLVYCADYRCSHSIAISGDAWPDNAPPREAGSAVLKSPPRIAVTRWLSELKAFPDTLIERAALGQIVDLWLVMDFFRDNSQQDDDNESAS